MSPPVLEKGTSGQPATTRGLVSTALVFVQDQTSESLLRQVLTNLGVNDAVYVSGGIKTAIAALAEQPSPMLLVVDISGIAEPIFHVNELANVCEPNTAVIVIGDRNDIVLYRDLKRAGVAEYFFKPLVGDLVTKTFNAIVKGTTPEPSPRTGKLVFVLGVRGGVGATTIAVNTAHYLADTRQRWVMLLDLDLQNGDAALQLDATPTHALREAFEHPERVDKLFLERAVIHGAPRMDLLASLEPLGEHSAYKESAALSVLASLLLRYRYVFVDLPAAEAGRLPKILELPSTCVLVSTGSLVSARDVARWRARLGPNTAERNVLHILNQSGGPAALPDADFLRAAGAAPDFKIAYDHEIGAASNFGVKGMQCAALSRGLAPLIRTLTGEIVPTSQSIFHRLFG